MEYKAKAAKAPQLSELGQKIPVWNWRGAILAADLEPLTKLVCLAISHYLSDAGKGWRVSVKQLMADTGIKSNKTISTHLEKAQKANLLVIQRTVKANGQRGVTLDKARFPHNVELSREPAEMPGDDGECGSEPGATATPGPSEPSVHGTPRPRAGRTPWPSAPDTRQESFQQEEAFQEGAFQERGTQARPAPAHDIVEATFEEIVQPGAGLKNQSRVGKLVTVKSAASTAHLLPEDWTPGEDGLCFALELGLTQQQAQIEFEKFCDYWRAQPAGKAKKRDWHATWRNWVRRSQEHLPRATARSGRADLSQFL